MENDTDAISKIVQPSVDSGSQPLPAEKPKVKTRPLIEGINTPKTTSDVVKIKPALTVQEEKLISQDQEFKPESTKLMPASVAFNSAKKNHHIGTWVMLGIILAALVFGIYQWYIWKINKNVLPIKTGYNHEVVAVPADQSSQWPVAVSTSTPQSTTSVNSIATTTPAVPPVITSLKIGATPTGFLNVRTSPSLSGGIIAKVYPGETYVYIAAKNNWYQITLANNKTGWISGQYVSVIK